MLLCLATMSLYGSVGRLDFEMGDRDEHGPQEFVDNHSMGLTNDDIIATTTIHGDAANGRVFIGYGNGESGCKVIRPMPGLHVVFANAGLGAVRLVEVPRAPMAGSPGTLLETELIRLDNAFKVVREMRYDFRPGQLRRISFPPGGLVKYWSDYDLPVDSRKALEAKLLDIDARQAAEYALVRHVWAAVVKHRHP